MNNWTKSSFSEGRDPNCVECRTDQERILLRDSRHPSHGHLAFSGAEWTAFLHALREGDLGR